MTGVISQYWNRFNLPLRRFLFYFVIALVLCLTAVFLVDEQYIILIALATLVHWCGIKLVDFDNPYNRLWKSLLFGLALLLGIIFTHFFVVIVIYGLLRCMEKYYYLEAAQLSWACVFYVLSGGAVYFFLIYR